MGGETTKRRQHPLHGARSPTIQGGTEVIQTLLEGPYFVGPTILHVYAYHSSLVPMAALIPSLPIHVADGYT